MDDVETCLQPYVWAKGTDHERTYMRRLPHEFYERHVGMGEWVRQCIHCNEIA